MDEKKTPTNVRLPPELLEAAKIQAVKEHRPLSEVIEELLRKWLAEKGQQK